MGLAPGTCRPPEPVPLSHVTRVSPFQDIQSNTIFKYSLNLIKVALSLYFERKRNRERLTMRVCLDSFRLILLESVVNLLCLERIIIFLAANVIHIYMCHELSIYIKTYSFELIIDSLLH